MAINAQHVLESLQVISPRMHGMLDYPTGAALLAAPNLLGLADEGGPAAMVPRALGAMILGQSAMTDYDMGLVKALPFKAHLALDYLAGPLLALSPFLFGFRRKPARSWLPHVLAGLYVLVTTLMTRPHARPRLTPQALAERARAHTRIDRPANEPVIHGALAGLPRE
jgi:hypothetical protein